MKASFRSTVALICICNAIYAQSVVKAETVPNQGESKTGDILFGKEVKTNPSETVADISVRVKSLNWDAYLSTFQRLSEIGKDKENAATYTADEQKADLAGTQELLRVSLSQLQAFAEEVAAGKVGNYFDPTMLGDCAGILQPLADKNIASNVAIKDTLVLTGSTISACDQKASTLQTKLQGDIAQLKKSQEARKKELEEIDKKLKNTPSEAEKIDLEKKKKDLDDQQARDAEKQRQAEKASSGYQSLRIILGVAALVAGIVLCYFGDVVDGVSLIAAGLSALFGPTGSGGSGSATDSTRGAPYTQSSGTVADGVGSNTTSVNQKKVNDASNAPISANSAETLKQYEPTDWSFIKTSTPPGNVALRYNAKKMVIELVRADKVETIVTIDLHAVNTSPGLFPGLKLSDLTQIKTWSVVSKDGPLKLMLSADFGGANQNIALIEIPGKPFVALITPETVLAK